jgi:hypothetical protein
VILATDRTLIAIATALVVSHTGGGDDFGTECSRWEMKPKGSDILPFQIDYGRQIRGF